MFLLNYLIFFLFFFGEVNIYFFSQEGTALGAHTPKSRAKRFSNSGVSPDSVELGPTTALLSLHRSMRILGQFLANMTEQFSLFRILGSRSGPADRGAFEGREVLCRSNCQPLNSIFAFLSVTCLPIGWFCKPMRSLTFFATIQRDVWFFVRLTFEGTLFTPLAHGDVSLRPPPPQE